MSWNLKWEGRATDFVPDLLSATGKPGRVAHSAREAIYEAVQCIGEQMPNSIAFVHANGWEDVVEPGLGQFNLSITVKSADEPQEATASREQAVAPLSPGPASSVP